jgi:hypothetical protein
LISAFFISLRFLIVSLMVFLLELILWYQPHNETLLVLVSLVCIAAGFFSVLIGGLGGGLNFEVSACFADCHNEDTILGLGGAVLLLLSGFLPLPFACKQCGKASRAATATAATTTTTMMTTPTTMPMHPTAATPFDAEAGVVEITTRPTDARAGAAERVAVATIVAIDPEPPTGSAAPSFPGVSFAKAVVVP